MAVIDFGVEIDRHKDAGIDLAKQDEPDFALARFELGRAHLLSTQGNDPLKVAIFTGRITNDFGVVDVREGLYVRNYEKASDEDAQEHVAAGISKIEDSYNSLLDILAGDAPTLAERDWEPGIHGHICGTMNTWLRAVQTMQLLRGEIGLDKHADQAAIKAQWMLGRGTSEEPGAWAHAQRGDNGYWAVQTPFLGGRAERINGGIVHQLKGVKWIIARGIPELGRRMLDDPKNRKNIVLTAGRLSLESLSRKHAIESALDHRRF